MEYNDEQVFCLNEKSAFIQYNKIRVVQIESNRCRVEALITNVSKNIFGVVHGGLIYTMVDTAAGALARYGNPNRNVTITASINYLLPAQNTEKLYADAHEVRRGNHIGVYCVEVVDDSGNTIAVATVTMSMGQK